MYVSPSSVRSSRESKSAEVRHPERRLVAVELDAALLAGADPEARRHARDDAVLELEHRDVEVGRRRAENATPSSRVRSGWSVVANAVTRRAGPNIAVRIVIG